MIGSWPCSTANHRHTYVIHGHESFYGMKFCLVRKEILHETGCIIEKIGCKKFKNVKKKTFGYIFNIFLL